MTAPAHRSSACLGIRDGRAWQGHSGPDLGTRIAVRPGCRPAGCAGLCTEAGLAAAYRAHRGRLLSRARFLLRDAGLAEEVVQETFVRAWRACAAFDPDGPAELSWLGVILRNVALDRMRARRRRPESLRDLLDDRAAPVTGPSEVDLFLLREELREALGALGSEHRVAVEETILRGRPSGEVAAELGVPAGTVRSRVHYGLRRMRRRMDAAGSVEGSPLRSTGSATHGGGRP